MVEQAFSLALALLPLKWKDCAGVASHRVANESINPSGIYPHGLARFVLVSIPKWILYTSGAWALERPAAQQLQLCVILPDL